MQTAAQYNQAFREFLDALNPEQRSAVDQTEGPVLVLAGPGTGKTQVLAARIGNILLTTDARPQNLLCLTFTDAGVHAMRERLKSLIGPVAHRIPVMTYHTFCNRVIQENSEYFGPAGELLTDLERIGIIRQMLDKLPPHHPLREGYKSPYQTEVRLRNLFSMMKKERWKPGDIHKAAFLWLQKIPSDPAFVYKKKNKNGNKGDINRSKVAEIEQKMLVLREAADLYPAYLHALEQANRYEYEDMILWTIQAFEKHENLLRNYQEKFQYVLVDEFQDTNGAQNYLLQQLISYWDTPNIFIVGDDDQSIFEFQGARLHNLIDFYQTYQRDLLTVVLTRNYRSLQPILDTAQHVIEQNQLRAASQMQIPVDKHLIAQQTNLQSLQIRQVSYNSPLAEDTDIVDQIEQLIKNGENPEHIAVLCYRHKQYKRLIALFDRRNIPYQTKRPVNILEVPLIRQIREILWYAEEEVQQPFSGEHRLFSLLHAPFFQIPPIELARLALDINTHQISWREALLQSTWPAAQFLASLPGTQYNTDLRTWMETLLTRTGIIQYVLTLPDKAWYLQVLTTWMQFTDNSLSRDNQFNLYALLQMLDNMKDNRLEIPLQQTLKTGAGVHLVTVHGAKGLEYEHVFVPHCTKELWEPGGRTGGGQFYLPPTLTFSGEEDALESRRRLFFVALTRAKSHLQISFARTDDAGKPLAYARFLDETGLTTEPLADQPLQVLTAQAELLTEPAVPVITLPDAALFADFLEHFSLSANSLNKYLRCPLAFYYEEVLHIPSAMSDSALTGIAVHHALQVYFKEMLADSHREFPPAERLVQIFEREMYQHRQRFPEQVFLQRLNLYNSTLLRYATEQQSYWRKRSKVEFQIRHVEMEGMLLSGALDKIEFLDNGTIRVVDYKTGKRSASKFARPDEQQPLGGEYFRQLLFYKILLESSLIFAEPVQKGAVSWIEPDKKGNFILEEHNFTAQDVQWLKTLMHQTWEHIHALRFDKGCEQPDCSWCKMHRERLFYEIPFAPEDELDDDME